MFKDLKILIISYINSLTFEWLIGVLGSLFVLCFILFLFVLRSLIEKGEQDQIVENLKEEVKDLNVKVSNTESKIASLDSQIDSLQKQSDSLLRIVISQRDQSE